MGREEGGTEGGWTEEMKQKGFHEGQERADREGSHLLNVTFEPTCM